MSSGIDEDDISTAFFLTNAPWMITATNGSLSAVCSILIMYIILRSSPEARNSVYHIIMFFMSFWDAIASSAIAFNTIPMPSNVYEVYPFAGKALGTITTCELQGFLIQMATLFVFGSNTTLNMYYVCTFRYSMAEEKFKRLIMPVMLAFYTAISVGIPTSALRMDLINPSQYGNYCLPMSQYPYGCSSDLYLLDDDKRSMGVGEEFQGESTKIACIRGSDSINFETISLMLYSVIGGTFFIMVTSLTLVVATVFDAELGIRRSRRSRRALRDGELEAAALDDDSPINRQVQEIDDFKRTKAIFIQAMMYVSAFLLTWIWMIIFRANAGTQSNTLSFLGLFFRPLQGFFNTIIFVYQKVHILRRSDIRLSFFGAFKQVIMSPSTVPQVVVSHIEIATEEIGIRRQEQGSIIMQHRQEIAHNSDLRRLGLEMNDVLSASISSGVGSSSLGDISFWDMIGSRSSFDNEHGNDHNDDDDEDSDLNSFAIISEEGSSSPLSSDTNHHLSLPNHDTNPSVTSFSMDSTLDSVFQND